MNKTSVQDSPESPESIQETPKSPDEILEEEILFVEDRRPGNVPLVISKLVTDKDQPVISEDFIKLSSNVDKVNERLSESDFNKEYENKDIDTNSMNEQLFIEDRNPQLTGQDTQSPRYKINDKFVKLQNPNAVKKRNRFANTCWNCGETSHSLRDCTEPKNYDKISRARKVFQESKANVPAYKRYHVEETQRFGHMVPGQLSQELREALGVHPGELPVHIYMMRRLGYPPGWLKEALISYSGIAMFDGQGREVLAPGVEGGEIVTKGMLDKYDDRKIFQFPGFNVPPPPNTYDDGKFWNCPPISKMQSIDVMLQRLGGRVVGGYKRKKLSHNATVTSGLGETSQSIDFEDMDYEEVGGGNELPADNCRFIPPLPEEELPLPPPTDLPPEPSSLSSSVCETSLIELEEQKKQLLAELNDVSPSCSTPTSRVGKIKSVDLGTPILKSVSPYGRLPTAEKFSVNICDVINFENLPDSTGKYNQMSGIIRKVRSKLSQLNDET